MVQTSLTVGGMSCGGCEQNVEDALEDLDGVTSSTADHETDSVEVTFDDGRVDVDSIGSAIEEAGYDVIE